MRLGITIKVGKRRRINKNFSVMGKKKMYSFWIGFLATPLVCLGVTLVLYLFISFVNMEWGDWLSAGDPKMKRALFGCMFLIAIIVGLIKRDSDSL